MNSLQELLDANMPAPEMFKEYLEATGEELPQNYSGTSLSISLSEIFIELLQHDEFWILDAKEPVPYLVLLSDEEYLGMMTRRFRLTQIEHDVLRGYCNMLEKEVNKWVHEKTYSRYEIYLYFTLLRLIYRYECTLEGGKQPTFAGIWQVWEKAFYPEILPPPNLIRNILEMFEIAYNPKALRDFPRDVLPTAEMFEDAVYVALQLDVNTILDFWMADINCKEIRILLDSGIDSREALALGKRLPDAWIEALNMEPRKWQ